MLCAIPRDSVPTLSLTLSLTFGSSPDRRTPPAIPKTMSQFLCMHPRFCMTQPTFLVPSLLLSTPGHILWSQQTSSHSQHMTFLHTRCPHLSPEQTPTLGPHAHSLLHYPASPPDSGQGERVFPIPVVEPRTSPGPVSEGLLVKAE